MTGFHVGPDVAWVDARAAGHDGDEVFVARIPHGPPLVLRDSAWLIWSIVTEHPELEDVVTRVAAQVGSTRETVAPEVELFLAQLVDHGLLQRAEPTA